MKLTMQKGMTAIVKTMLAAAVAVAMVVQATADDAVWTNKTNSSQTWKVAANWQDGYIGGETAANADDINFAYPFNTADGTRYGQPIDMASFSPSFHSVTGLPFQVFTRTGTGAGTLTVVDPNGFRGIWATAGLSSQYNVTPEGGKTAEFQRVAHGWQSVFNVASGGKARINDLLGKGSLFTSGVGELVVNTPRTLGTRVILVDGGTLTVESPTEPETPAPAAGASWRFDAAATNTFRTIEADGRTYITNWWDADGGEAMAYASLDSCRPFLSPITVNGHQLVDFGAYKNNSSVYVPSGADALYGPAAFMLVGKTNNLSVVSELGKDVCEMFVVVKVHEESNTGESLQSVLGRNGDYQIPMMFYSNAMFYRTRSRTTYGNGAAANRSEGDYRAWLNGEPYFGTTLNEANALADVARWNPTELNVIAVNFKGGARPTLTALGTSRYVDGKECGGFALAEALIYKTELTDAERRQTIEYLKRKWLSGMEAKPFDMDAAIIGNAAAKMNVEAGNTAKIRTLRRAANVAASANIVKSGEGTLEVEEIMPQSATLEVKGGAVMLSHDTPVASTDRTSVPTDGMLCWLDATSDGAFDTDGSGGITKWKDCRDGYSSTVFAANANGSATSKPTAETDSTSGLTVVDFGATVDAAAPYFKITVNGSNMANVKETFIVWKRNGDGVPGLICGSDREGAKRDSNGTLMHRTWNIGYAVAMLWNVDGCPISASAIYDFTNVGNGKLAVVSGSSKKPNPWCYLAYNSNQSNKGGGCAIGEVIAYNRQLTDAERRNVTAYLMNKWENGATYSLDTDDTVAKISFTGGAAPKVGTKTDRTVTTITGSGTFTKTGAGKLTVTSLDSSVTALDIQEGEMKCDSIANVTEISTWLDADGNIGTVSLGSGVTLSAAMTVNVAIDPEFNGKSDYPIIKADSYASAPDISGWTLNVTGVSGGEFRLARCPGGICLRSGVRGTMIIVR